MNGVQRFKKKKMIDTQEIRKKKKKKKKKKNVHLSVYYLIGIVYIKMWRSG